MIIQASIMRGLNESKSKLEYSFHPFKIYSSHLYQQSQLYVENCPSTINSGESCPTVKQKMTSTSWPCRKNLSQNNQACRRVIEWTHKSRMVWVTKVQAGILDSFWVQLDPPAKTNRKVKHWHCWEILPKYSWLCANYTLGPKRSLMLSYP